MYNARPDLLAADPALFPRLFADDPSSNWKRVNKTGRHRPLLTYSGRPGAPGCIYYISDSQSAVTNHGAGEAQASVSQSGTVHT